MIPLANSAESAGFLEQSAIFFSEIGHFLLRYVNKIRGIAHFCSARCLFGSYYCTRDQNQDPAQ